MLDRLNPWRTEKPSAPAPTDVARARLRIEYWGEYKRIHLGFVQTLSSLMHGRSNPSVLLKYAMQAEFEGRRLAGEHAEQAESVLLDGAMKMAVMRCRIVYARINDKAFDDAALAALASPKDAPTLEAFVAMLAAPFTKADASVIEESRAHDLDEGDRIARFTPEIQRAGLPLRKAFAEAARRAGLV